MSARKRPRPGLQADVETGHPPAILRLTDVTKSFGENHVLRGINLSVGAGRSLVVLGGSGSGKSVMLKTALGLIRADSGEIWFDGHDLTTCTRAELSARRARMGMLFQAGALFDSLPVWENVAFRLVNAERMGRDDARESAIGVLKRVRLAPDVADLMPSEISGGMKKRVALARAIISEPALVFFDEPTTGLDPITTDAINDLIIEQVKEGGSASISITHDMATARKIADDVAMLYQGRIIWCGPVNEIDQSGNAFVDQFVNGRADGPIAALI